MDGAASLESIREEIEIAKDMMGQAYREMQDPNVSGKAAVAQWVAVNTRYVELIREYRKEKRKLDERRTEVAVSVAYEQEVKTIEKKLLAQYGSRGPQYEVLCRILAPLVVRLMRSHSGEMRLSAGEQNDLTKTVQGIIAQLQRHTEALRTENTQMIQQVAVHLLRSIEPRLSHQPELWGEIVSTVRKALAEQGSPEVEDVSYSSVE